MYVLKMLQTISLLLSLHRTRSFVLTVGVTALGIFSAIPPQIAIAQNAALNLSLNRELQESYNNFLRRAETLASKTIQAQFAQNPSLPEVNLTVVGENQGAIAPVLSIKVSRDRWTSDPKVGRWAMYFPNSKALLGFDRPSTPPQAATSPSSPSAVGSTPAPQGTNPATQPTESPAPLPSNPMPTQVPTLPLDSGESSPTPPSERLLRLPSTTPNSDSF